MGKRSNAATLPRREYGKTGIRLSVIGFGGIAVMGAEPAQASRAVGWAVERGVNYFDVAPTYGDAEKKLGPALEPYRKGVFLACKTTERTGEGAEAELDRSLQRLRTDYFDLYQLHALTEVKKDVDAAFDKGGIMAFLVKAKKAGQIRHIGFSAHSTEAALAAMDRYDFDSVLFPFNFVTWHGSRFGTAVLEKAQANGAARLALKTLARQVWPDGEKDRSPFKKCWYQPVTHPREAGLAVKFTLSLPVTAAVTPGEEALMRLAVDCAMNFTPITKAEDKELQALAKTLKPIF